MGKNKHRQAKDTELDIADEVVEAAPEEMEEVVEEKAVEHKVDFDGWHAMRKHRIPVIHKKEILKADFKARKVPTLATMREFDEALKKYGVQLA